MHGKLQNVIPPSKNPEQPQLCFMAIIFSLATCCVCSGKERCSQAVFPRLSEQWWRGQAGFCQELGWWACGVGNSGHFLVALYWEVGSRRAVKRRGGGQPVSCALQSICLRATSWQGIDKVEWTLAGLTLAARKAWVLPTWSLPLAPS